MKEPKQVPRTRVVEKDGERFTYLVESSTEPGMGHVVDLTANGGLGVCTCENYRFRIARIQRTGEYIEWRPGRKGCSECRHIYAARRQMIRKKLNKLMASFHNGQPENVGEVLREFLAWKGL